MIAMKTIALRFTEKFAPDCGTISAHQEVIDQCGCVWYGKFGSSPADKVISKIIEQDNFRILLIHSGGTERYWAYVSDYQREKPTEAIPQYYEKISNDINCWFKVIKIEPAAKDVMSKCTVASSNAVLSLASRYSMSPYFIINYDEEE